MKPSAQKWMAVIIGVKCRKSLKAAAGYGEPLAVLGDLSQNKAGARLVMNDTKPQPWVRTETLGLRLAAMLREVLEQAAAHLG